MDRLHSRKPLSMRGTSLALGLVAASVFTTALASPSIAAPARTASVEEKTDAGLEREIAGLLRHNEGAERVGKDRVLLEPGVEMTVAPSSGAAAGMDDCKLGYACVWQHAGFGGYRLDFYNYGSYQLADYSMPNGESWQDKVSSYYNHQTGGAWMVGKDWVSLGGSSGWEWIFGGPGNSYASQVGGNDRADLIELYP